MLVNESENISRTMFDYMRAYRSTFFGNAYAYGRKKRELFLFLKRVDKVAGSFVNMGIKKGDNIVICLPNIPQAVIALYAANRIGATVSVIYPKSNPEVFKAQLDLTKPKICILSDVNVMKYRKSVKGIKLIVCPMFSEKFIGLKKSVKFEPYHSDGNDIAVYMHSSGTTGAPKTSRLTNKNINALSRNMLKTLGDPYDERGTMLSVLPIFHGFGLAATIHASMCTRMMLCLVPYFDAGKVLKKIKKYNVTCMNVIPNMLAKMVKEKHFGECLKTVKAIYVGGDSLGEELVKEVYDKLAASGSEAKIIQGYGFTEMGSVCTLNTSGEKSGSIGKPLSGVEVELLNDGKKVKQGEVGEMCFAGEQLMIGYLGEDRGPFVEIDGKEYLRSGDLAVMDEDGYLYFKGREKRLIKISGINVFPTEIERVVNSIEEVESSCAICRYNAKKPYVHLIVELKGDYLIDDEMTKKIINVIKSNLSHWYIPKTIEQVDEMPITDMGKLDYKYFE